MCGIVGAFADHPLPPPDIVLLRHRGPDAYGVVRVALGHRSGWIGGSRLAITGADEPISMPLAFGHLGIVLAFVGEVYNWRALRAELSDDALPWRTESDAEVVARAWRRWGPGALDRFNGMFAFALADLHDGILHLARDRAGEKPLYYATDGDALRFASEIKAIGLPLEEAACRDADALEFDCLRDVPFAGVAALLPGERAEWRPGAPLALHTWWSPPVLPPADEPVLPVGDRLTEAVRDAVQIRVPEEVPFAVLVSGGLDSALIQAVAHAPRVYCLRFPDDGLDPLPLAQQAAVGAEVVPVTFGLRDAERVLDQVAWHLDTPATWTALAYWFLAQRMAADGVRVVLTGDGADELFGGYARYRALWWLEQMRADPALADYSSMLGQLLGTADDEALLARVLDRGDATHSRALVERLQGDGDLPARMARADWHTTMQVNLRMVDRIMMAHGIENRSPLLDPRVIDIGFRMRTDCKITPNESKAALREVARRLGVPHAIIADRCKAGLAVPWNRWRRASAGLRGPWDRSDFRDAMRAAWRRAFALDSAAGDRVASGA